ncbi:MAG: hypothetical protein JWO82_3098 [Akkermansiaceae bacterium]|nr:hypothetical protein [Akkermansiaceae bacterium]
MAQSPGKDDVKNGSEEKGPPLQVPAKEPVGDGFPAEKDVSKAPPGSDQSESTSPPGRPKKDG